MKYLTDKDVLAIGPGMGDDPSLNKLIGKILDQFKGIKFRLKCKKVEKRT